MLTSCHLDRSADVLTIEWSLPRSPSLVWRHLKDPDKLDEWLGQPLSFDARVGGEIVVDHDDGYSCRSEILSLSRPHIAELSWEFPDEPTTRLSLTTFEASDAAGQHEMTALVLKHMGLGSLIGSYASGWMTHLTYCEASLCETPLPQTSSGTYAQHSLSSTGRRSTEVETGRRQAISDRSPLSDLRYRRPTTWLSIRSQL